MPIPDRELFDRMTQAAYRAANAAEENGHKRDSQIAKDSAWSAAQAVYFAERPDEAPITRHPTTREPVEDVVQERMEREPVYEPVLRPLVDPNEPW
jgi:hypothetical protein